jgi:transcriptional regulator with XRE-family HTH domain
MPISRLRQARKKAKLTLERLAQDVGLSVSQLSRFETGDRTPRLPEIERIAKTLGVTVDYLRGVSKPPGEIAAETADKEQQTTGLSEEQAHVVRLVVQAFLGWLMADPLLREKMKTAAYQSSIARVIAQYARSQRLHEAVARDGDATLAAIQTALEIQQGEEH